MIAEYNKIFSYDETKQLNKDNDLRSVIKAVNTMVENDKNSLCKNVQKIYYAKYEANSKAEKTRRKARELLKKVDAAIEKIQSSYHGVLMRF